MKLRIQITNCGLSIWRFADGSSRKAKNGKTLLISDSDDQHHAKQTFDIVAPWTCIWLTTSPVLYLASVTFCFQLQIFIFQKSFS